MTTPTQAEASDPGTSDVSGAGQEEVEGSRLGNKCRTVEWPGSEPPGCVVFLRVPSVRLASLKGTTARFLRRPLFRDNPTSITSVL